MVWMYFAGLSTPFVVCIILVSFIWSITPNSLSSSRCPICVVANLRARTYGIGESKNIIVWSVDWWHEIVTSRRRIHRYAWQAHYEEKKIDTAVGRRQQVRYGWNWDD